METCKEDLSGVITQEMDAELLETEEFIRLNLEDEIPDEWLL
jgi:hypothetical protein